MIMAIRMYNNDKNDDSDDHNKYIFLLYSFINYFDCSCHNSLVDFNRKLFTPDGSEEKNGSRKKKSYTCYFEYYTYDNNNNDNGNYHHISNNNYMILSSIVTIIFLNCYHYNYYCHYPYHIS